MGFRFIKTPDPSNDYAHVEVSLSTEQNDLDIKKLLMMIEDFMRACGYSIEMETLRIVEKDE